MRVARQPFAIQLIWPALAMFAALGGQAAAQQPSRWKTGAAFRQELDRPLSVVWSEQPLREALVGLSQSVGVPMFLDRRIDPSQTIDLTVRDEPLEMVLSRVAQAAKAEKATMGTVVYLGPPETALKLATVAAIRRQDASQLAGEAKARLLRSQSWQWDELTEPRKLLDRLAPQASVSIQNPDAVPHDLWPAANLPPLPWVDRLTLLLAGFGLTFELAGDGASVQLVPMPESPRLEKSYAVGSLSRELATRLEQIIPDAHIRTVEGKLVVAGTHEDHEKVERLLSGQSGRAKSEKRGPTEKRYTLPPGKQRAGDIVRTIAVQLGKELKYDPTALPKLRQEIVITAKNATLDELLTATLQPLGLSYKITDTTLEVVAE